MADGSFYEFTQNGQIQECNAGPRLPSGRALLETYDDGRGNICGIDFFDSVSQIRSPTSRHNLYVSFNYDITDNLRYSSDVVYANTNGTELVNQGGFQTGFFGGTSAAITVPLDNPFLSSQARQTLLDAGLEGDQFSIHRFNNDLVSSGGNSNETHTWRVSNILEGEFEFLDRD